MPGESVGKQVARRRNALGYSVRQLAEKADMGRSTITRIENDDPKVEQFTLARLLRCLDDLEHKLGTDEPDVTTVTLASGHTVTFPGRDQRAAEAAAAFLKAYNNQ